MITLPTVDVAVGILQNTQGHCLLAQRNADRSAILANYWEFPGGKVEPHETVAEALCRELKEEIGISVLACNPWLIQEADYEHIKVRLHFFHVSRWEGIPAPLEHRDLIWCHAKNLATLQVLPPNLPILKKLCLPTQTAITCATEWGEETMLKRLSDTICHNPTLMIHIREKDMIPQKRRRFANRIMQACQNHQGPIVYSVDNAQDMQDALTLGCDGIHLSAKRLHQLNHRPETAWVGASCHTEADIQTAQQMGCDYLYLSPVYPTQSHPKQTPLGWDRFEALARQSGLPVFALGGLLPNDLTLAQQHRAHGIASMRALWTTTPTASL